MNHSLLFSAVGIIVVVIVGGFLRFVRKRGSLLYFDIPRCSRPGKAPAVSLADYQLEDLRFDFSVWEYLAETSVQYIDGLISEINMEMCRFAFDSTPFCLHK